MKGKNRLVDLLIPALHKVIASIFSSSDSARDGKVDIDGIDDDIDGDVVNVDR